MRLRQRATVTRVTAQGYGAVCVCLQPSPIVSDVRGFVSWALHWVSQGRTDRLPNKLPFAVAHQEDSR